MQSTNEELETTNDELRLRTDELNEANAALDSVLASLHVAVAVVDSQLRVQLWNRQAEDLWGLRRDEVLGAHLLNLDVGLPLAELRDPIRAVFAKREAPPLAVDAVTRRGVKIRCRVAFTPLRSGRAGEPPSGVILLMEASGDGA